MRAKALHIRLTPLAQADLYIRLMTSSFANLASGKNVGVQCLAGNDYLRHLVGSHVVFYRETAETRGIIRLLHQRMDVDRHP